MVFKSLAEPTPFSDVISTTLTVRWYKWKKLFLSFSYFSYLLYQ
jgi:hypothetical protein